MGRVVVSVTVGLDIMDDNVGKYTGDSTAGIGFVLAVPPGAAQLGLLTAGGPAGVTNPPGSLVWGSGNPPSTIPPLGGLPTPH